MKESWCSALVLMEERCQRQPAAMPALGSRRDRYNAFWWGGQRRRLRPEPSEGSPRTAGLPTLLGRQGTSVSGAGPPGLSQPPSQPNVCPVLCHLTRICTCPGVSACSEPVSGRLIPWGVVREMPSCFPASGVYVYSRAAGRG